MLESLDLDLAFIDPFGMTPSGKFKFYPTWICILELYLDVLIFSAYL